MNILKLSLSILLTLILSSSVSLAQIGSITIENNFSQPTCTACTTLHATATPITGISSTGSYAVVQNAYSPYPYVGTTFLTSAVNFGGIIDDHWSNVLNLPFTFCFFNNAYDKYVVSLNGQLGFDLSNALQGNTYTLSTTPLPNNNIDLNNTIMGAFPSISTILSSS